MLSVNHTARPLIFLGSNSNIHKLAELAQACGVRVLGMIDDDYCGAGEYQGIPVIGSEADVDQFKDCQWLCATNWTPDADSARNRLKRARQLDLMNQFQLKLATLIHPMSVVSTHANIGAGTVVYAFATVEPRVRVGQHTILYDYSVVGHDCTIGNNVVAQRQVLITSSITVEDNVYMGMCSQICRSHVTVSNGTFVHPNIMLLRGTVQNEVVSLAGRKVYALTRVE
jgi:NDP-sugar pyrophosphorylase family protein